VPGQLQEHREAESSRFYMRCDREATSSHTEKRRHADNQDSEYAACHPESRLQAISLINMLHDGTVIKAQQGDST